MNEKHLPFPDLKRSLLLSELNLFLRYPVISKGKQTRFNNFLLKVDNDFQGLLNQSEITSNFERFFYESGLNRPVTLREDVLKEIIAVNPIFDTPSRESVKIMTRRSMLRVASSEILKNKKIAFINFDLKDLRLADQAGYADFLLSDFAKVLNKVSNKYSGTGKIDRVITLLPARVGGDEFSIFVSSSGDIQKETLENIYKEVEEELSQIKAYYQVVGEERIEEKPAKLKSESIEDQILIANNDKKRRLFLSRAIIKGRIPSKDQLKGEKNVRNDEFSTAKAISQKKFAMDFDNDPSSLRKKVESIINSHPEYSFQIDLLLQLINENKTSLANYLFSVIQDYLKDPLINEPIHSFSDLIIHLDHWEPKPEEKLIYYYIPWLKVLNNDIGYSNTDEIIERSYQDIIRFFETQGYDRNNIIVARKGADFIFLVKEYQVGEKILNYHDFFPAGHLFSEGMPVFTATINYPKKGGNLSQSIEDIEKIARSSFVNWLDRLFKKEPEKTKGYINYYLRERTIDRRNELFNWLSYIQNPSEGLIKYLSDYSINLQV